MTKETAPEQQALDQEIEELLPWHAAGTLNRRDAQRVEDAIVRDPALARRYALVREEMMETIGVNESLGAPSTRAMDALFEKIDAEPERHPLPRLNLVSRLGEFVAGLTPRTLAFATGAAALALLLQAGIITGVLLNEKPGGYQTASAPATTPADGSYAMIRFAPQATAADITKFLDANKLSLAGGPAAGGMYRVRLAATALPKPDLARLVKQLQQDKAVELIAAIE
jgi:anti-sigma factor RsiW